MSEMNEMNEINEIKVPFKGIHYTLPSNWLNIIKVNDYENKAINYLEIGTFYGANIIYFAYTYGKHPDSKLYCIDPYEDYNDYPEFKNQLNETYKTFLENVENNKLNDKIIHKRGYSNNEILKFDNEFFDIIYIDANHEPEYVLEDAVLSFRKLKINGILIFDDYIWGGLNITKKGIDAFLNAYSNRYEFLEITGNQVFIKKIK